MTDVYADYKDDGDYSDYGEDEYTLEDMDNELKEGDMEGQYDMEYESDDEDNEGGMLVGGRVRHMPPCGKMYSVQSHRGSTTYCKRPPGEAKKMRGPKRPLSEWQRFVKANLSELLDRGVSFRNAIKELSNDYRSRKGSGFYGYGGEGGLLLGGGRNRSCVQHKLVKSKYGHLVGRCAKYGPPKKARKPTKGVRKCKQHKLVRSKAYGHLVSRCAKY